MLIFDIGANVGEWTLARITPTNRIIAVEADPNTFNTLRSRTQHLANVIPLNFAVCDSSESTVRFFRSEGSISVLSSLNKDWFEHPVSRFHGIPFEQIECTPKSLDALISEYGCPDLIKIDVESAEFKVLSSLHQRVPLLCFEWTSEYSPDTFQCIDYLYALGYRDFSIQYGDDYVYTPKVYTDIDSIKDMLSECTPRVEYGMLWANETA